MPNRYFLRILSTRQRDMAPVRTLPAPQLEHLDLFLAVQYATAVLWASQFLRDDPVRRAQHEAWWNGEGAHLLRYVERR